MNNRNHDGYVDLAAVAAKAKATKNLNLEEREKRGQEMSREKALAMFSAAYHATTDLDPRNARLIETQTHFGFAWAFVPRDPLENFRPEHRETILASLEYAANTSRDDGWNIPGAAALLKLLQPTAPDVQEEPAHE